MKFIYDGHSVKQAKTKKGEYGYTHVKIGTKFGKVRQGFPNCTTIA